ncbi:MAG: hypothetical protein AAF826_08140 [Pseudomonadota bacterium]
MVLKTLGVDRDTGSKARLRKCQNGAVSVEFVLMSVFYVFVVSILYVMCDMIISANKAYKANSNVANVVSRYQSGNLEGITINQWVEIYRAIANASADESYFRISELQNINGVLRVNWSHSSEGTTDVLENNDSVIANSVPVIANGDIMVLLETSVQYEPPFSVGIIGLQTIGQVSVFVYRFIPNIPFDDNNLPYGTVKYIYDDQEGTNLVGSIEAVTDDDSDA